MSRFCAAFDVLLFKISAILTNYGFPDNSLIFFGVPKTKKGPLVFNEALCLSMVFQKIQTK